MTSVLTFPSPNVPLTFVDSNDKNMPPPALRIQTPDRLLGQRRSNRFKGFNDAYEELVRTTLKAAGGKIADVYEEAAAAVRQKCPKRTDFTGKSARQAIDSIKNRVRITYKATNRTGTGTIDGLTIEEQREKLCPDFSVLWPLVNSLQDKEPKYVLKLKSTAWLSPPHVAPLPLPCCSTAPPLLLHCPSTAPPLPALYHLVFQHCSPIASPPSSYDAAFRRCRRSSVGRLRWGPPRKDATGLASGLGGLMTDFRTIVNRQSGARQSDADLLSMVKDLQTRLEEKQRKIDELKDANTELKMEVQRLQHILDPTM
ncbi:hypothetical protein BGZ47_007510 [Haplosporangium gracile]|nr:hypothetical protein BGZ47_007510 [Haplosporangium gracile]